MAPLPRWTIFLYAPAGVSRLPGLIQRCRLPASQQPTKRVMKDRSAEDRHPLDRLNPGERQVLIDCKYLQKEGLPGGQPFVV